MTEKEKMKKAKEARKALESVTDQLAALGDMTVAQLREKYLEVFGEPTRSRHKDYLRKRIGWQIQANAEGGLSERAKARIEELAKDAPTKWRKRRDAAESEVKLRDPRLPEPGSILHRIHKDVDHEVKVLDEGFEYQGRRYKSLSKIAKEITGMNWNGFLFFGLQRRSRKRDKK